MSVRTQKVNLFVTVNCIHQVKVTKHPWNNNPTAKGAISDPMGYVCLVFTVGEDRKNVAIFSDREQGMCELFTPYQIDETELKVYPSGSMGGMSTGRMDLVGVKVTHVPTGINVVSESEPNQKENLIKAKLELARKVYWREE